MAVPSISPGTTGSPVYTVHHSKGLVADLSLDVGISPPFPAFELRFPDTGDVVVSLVRAFKALPLLPGPVDDTTTFAKRRIVSEASPAGTDIVLTVEIQATSAATPGEKWSLRVQSGTEQPLWQFSQAENTPSTPTITRIMCDPAAGFTISAPALADGTVREGIPVTLTAVPPFGTAADPTVVGAPKPSVAHKWSTTGGLAIPAFPACSPSPLLVFTSPPVYAARSVDITEDVWFETGCPGPAGILNNTSPSQQLTIENRPQHLAVVLDRSGSMSGDRWTQAKTATQVLGNLFTAMRAGVNSADRIELLVFEDGSCTWHTVADPLIQPVLAATDLGSADVAICSVNFGDAGSCTPIGDGLIRAIDDLGALPTQGDPKYTIVLLTDGYENSGSVRVSPNSPLPAGASGIPLFGVARQSGAVRQRVHQHLSLFTIGLGATVQEDVLDTLATQSQGVYRHVDDPADIADALTQVVKYALGVERVKLEPPEQLPPPEQLWREVCLEPGVNRLAVAVMWEDPNDTLELSWQQEQDSGWTTVAAAVKQCETHGFVSVDVASLFGGDEDSVPATRWRVAHLDSAGVPLPLVTNEPLFFIDLFVRVDVVFDREVYSTGDAMTMTARIRAGDEPVTRATVRVELARPGMSLGTFLSTHGAEYRPPQQDTTDPHAPKALMLAYLLGQAEMPDGLPVTGPQSIFEDGSDELFDDGEHGDGEAGNGNFTNRYTDLDKEGTYTWRFVIEGETPDGAPFSRVVTLSKWVGVAPDPESSSVTVEEGDFTRIVVWPRDHRGEFLGPFRPQDVIFTSSHCPFLPGSDEGDPNGVRYPCNDGGTILSRYDGGYSRDIDRTPGTPNTVTITVKGFTFPPVVMGERNEGTEP